MFEVIRTPPKVFLVGISTPNINGVERYLHHRDISWNNRDSPEHPEALLEMAGRVCYTSWHNPANKTRTEYVQNMFEHGHGSTSEHLWMNFMVSDLPRSTQLELVRHGDGTAFSFESTRFTDKGMRLVIPPAIRGLEDHERIFIDTALASAQTYRLTVAKLLKTYKALYPNDKTLVQKRAKEGARGILPNAQASDGMFSVNLRGLRWILQVRSDEHADQSIREFAFALYEEARLHLPTGLADVDIIPVTEGTSVIKFAYSKV